MNSFPQAILLLGAGAVVRTCFLPALRALGLTARTTIVDPALCAGEIKRAAPGATVHASDFRAFLSGPAAQQGYDIGIVALPNALHEAAVEALLDRGAHVLCEKPLALSSDACLRLGMRADAVRRRLAVNMPRRFFPSMAAAHAALAQGMAGDLLAIDIRHGGPYAWPAQSLAPFAKENGGVAADIGVHYLDLAEWLAGPLEPVSYSDDARGGVEAEAFYALRTLDGVPVSIELSRLRPLRNTMELTCARGRFTVAVDDLGHCTFTPSQGGPAMLMATAGRTVHRFEDCFRAQMEDFLRLVSAGCAPHVDAFQAARAVALIEWAYARRPVRLGATAPPVTVTGATGFIGSHLVERLAELGASPIVAPVRSPQTCAYIARFPVELRRTHLLDYGQVRDCVRGARYVFHLAYGRGGRDARAITTEGTRNVVEAAIAEGCECVVVLSSIYVFGRPEGTVTEAAPYRPVGGEYGASKARMERWCLARAGHAGHTRIVVLCPSCVYGPRGRTYSEMPASMASRSEFAWIEEGSGAANYTFVENLVDAMLLAAAEPSAHGQRFIINDGGTSWRDLVGPFVAPWEESLRSFTALELRELGRAAQRHTSLRSVCRAMLRDPQIMALLRDTAAANYLRPIARRMAPKLGEWLRGNMSGAPATKPAQTAPPAWLADVFGPARTCFSAEKARRVLGWTPRVDLHTGQARTIEWLRSMNLHPHTTVDALSEPLSV